MSIISYTAQSFLSCTNSVDFLAKSCFAYRSCCYLGLHGVFSASGLHRASTELPPEPAHRDTTASLLSHHIYLCSTDTFAIHSLLVFITAWLQILLLQMPPGTLLLFALQLGGQHNAISRRPLSGFQVPPSSTEGLDEHQSCSPTNQQSHHCAACSPQLPSPGESIVDFLSWLLRAALGRLMSFIFMCPHLLCQNLYAVKLQIK